MLLLSEVSRNLPLLTLSRHQSAFGFFLRKNMTLFFQPMMKKKSIFWCFFSAYVCMELKVGFRKLRKKWGSSKDLISPPRPSFSFSVLKNSVLHERTSSLLTQTYILCWRDNFAKFFVKMISRNFLWNWVSSCCCLASSASFECLSFFAFWLSQRLIVHFFLFAGMSSSFFEKTGGEK